MSHTSILVGRETATGTEGEALCFDCEQAFNPGQEVVRFRFDADADETLLIHTHCWDRRCAAEAELERLSNPKVEISGYRDPDGDVTLTVIVNGTKIDNVLIDIADPGAGYPYPLSEWRENMFRAWLTGASPTWTAAAEQYYRMAEDRYTLDDTMPAKDMQPGVAVAQLDIEAWSGDGKLRYGDGREAAEHDNTLRAAWALTAVLAAHDAMRDGADTLRVAEIARTTFEATVGTDEFHTSVQDLISDLWHLADARHFSFYTQPGEDADELTRVVWMLVQALREAVTGPWADRIEDGRTWDDIVTSAFRCYSEELRGQWA